MGVQGWQIRPCVGRLRSNPAVSGAQSREKDLSQSQAGRAKPEERKGWRRLKRDPDADGRQPHTHTQPPDAPAVFSSSSSPMMKVLLTSDAGPLSAPGQEKVTNSWQRLWTTKQQTGERERKRERTGVTLISRCNNHTVTHVQFYIKVNPGWSLESISVFFVFFSQTCSFSDSCHPSWLLKERRKDAAIPSLTPTHTHCPWLTVSCSE